MKTILTITRLIFVIILITSCGNYPDNNNSLDEKINIDKTLTINNVGYKLKISKSQDEKNYFVQNGNYDASENDIIDDEDEFWLNYSTNFKIEFFSILKLKHFDLSIIDR
jgi:hypothetical protein